MYRAANQAFRLSARNPVFDDPNLRGLFGSAGTPNNPGNHPNHYPDIPILRPPDCVALDSSRPNKLETNTGSNLCSPGLRRPDFPDLSGGYLAQRQVQQLVKTVRRLGRRAPVSRRMRRRADEVLTL
jgi:hypothetical protein